MQTLPSLVDIVPEARLNLVIHYLKQVGNRYGLLIREKIEV